MFTIHNPYISFIKVNETNYKIVIEPISRGLSNIIGNSLRRILLLYIQGDAIFKFKINNVSNEFSKIPSVKEDMFDLIFNLKQIDLKILEKNCKTVSLYLNKTKLGPVKLTDFVNSDKIKIFNNNIIFNTTDNLLLDMEIVINKGIGYIPAAFRKKEFFFIINNINIIEFITYKVRDKITEYKIDIFKNKKNDYIYIDTNYNPIKNIGYIIENIDIGSFKNQERLIMNINCNGLIDIKKTVHYALSILIEQWFSLKNSIDFEGYIIENNTFSNLHIKYLNLNNDIIQKIKTKRIYDFINNLNNLNKLGFNKKQLLEIRFNLRYFRFKDKQYAT